jgi:hypothetical protein
MDDPASLQNLRDIVEPTPVSWWPPAVGWWILSVIVAAVGIVIALRAWRRWQANAYRREALRELQSATNAVEIAAILKRTALCAFPRATIASLSGEAWSDWLRQTAGQEVPATVAETLEHGIYAETNRKEFADLASFVDLWIRHHRRAGR